MKNNALEILYEDAYLIVCVKPHGVPTQSRSISTPDMVSLLKNHIRRQRPREREPYLAVIHRLDQPVKGILVFAKTPFAAKELSRQLQNGEFGKYYTALVEGTPPAAEGILEDYLIKDSRTNTSRVCSPHTPGAKLARLHYWGRGFSQKPPSPIETALSPIDTQCVPNEATLLEIHLDTGRHHQIRVQLAHVDCPIVGDTKYNPHASESSRGTELKLIAYKLSFRHPKTQKLMEFQI